jgi:hypothetical protein
LGFLRGEAFFRNFTSSFLKEDGFFEFAARLETGFFVLGSVAGFKGFGTPS